MKTIRLIACLTALVTISTISQPHFAQTRPAEPVTAIKAGRLIDGAGAPVMENAVILIAGDKITDVGPASRIQIPSDAKVIDLSQKTVMPGIIDGHGHLPVRADYRTLAGQLEGMTHPDAKQTARAARNIRVQLLSGVTTLYMVGEVHNNDAYVKEAIEQGTLPGPRIYTSGAWITTTAGHGPEEYRNTNGPWEMRVAVRSRYEAGAHHLKLTLTERARVGPNSGKMYGAGQTNYTKEEIDAVVNELHRLGLKVTAHASGMSARVALEAGVDSIQHAGDLTEDLIALFIKKGVGFINTYTIGYQAFFDDEWTYLDNEANNIRDWIDRARRVHLDARRASPIREQNVAARWKELKRAKESGVMIALGTDNMPGLMPLEIANLVDAGFTPIEAIAAATGMAAKVLAIDQEVGTLRPGRYADIIAVAGKPDQNIYDLTPAQFIMVGGKDFSTLSFR